VRLKYTSTHRGEIFDVPPSGKVDQLCRRSIHALRRVVWQKAGFSEMLSAVKIQIEEFNFGMYYICKATKNVSSHVSGVQNLKPRLLGDSVGECPTRVLAMKRLGCVFAWGMFLFLGPMAYQGSRPPTSAETSKQELLKLENHWLEVENDPNALEAILAPDFLHVVPAGIITKDEQLAFMRRHPAPEQKPERHFEDMHVRVYGTVGIVNGIVVETGHGGRRKTLFTDVFARRNGKWQAVNAQELPAAEEEVQSEIRH
jgi:hypothetical protein